jgi:hypothetical protein
MPEFSHTLQVSAPPAEVFAILDDTSRTPQWLDRCTRLDNLGSGANDVFVTATGANDAMTSLTHTVVIRPKGLARLGSSRISRALPEQTLEALARLKALAEHS